MICRKRNCNSTEFKYEPVTFKNGTNHFKRICKKCGGHNYYASEEEVRSGMGMRPIEKKKTKNTKETKESRYQWNGLMSKIFKLGGQEMVDDFIQEINEMYEYERKSMQQMQRGEESI